jgi:molybdopterin/thiamine biosynthesis adenylyltransferase
MSGRAEDPVDVRYSRHCRLPELGRAGQERLLSAHILIVGCGALGTALASLAARAGVGAIRIVDRDFVDLSNLQRQTLFDEDDVAQRLPKAEAARRKLARINSGISVESIIADADPRNIETLMQGVGLVLDGTDNAETRYVINDACLKHGVPWIYGGVVGVRGMLMSVLPFAGPCLRCLYREPPATGTLPTCDTLGVLATVPALVAAMQATEALKILAGLPPAKGLISIDPWRMEFQSIDVARQADCPACGRREFQFLDQQRASHAVRLCGRDMVQISPSEPGQLDLDGMALALGVAGRATSNGFLLDFRAEDCELVVFRDGRVLVKGTSDPAIARSLVARYLGA